MAGHRLHRNAKDLIVLIEEFVDGRVSAAEFDADYSLKFRGGNLGVQGERRTLLTELAHLCEDYVEDTALRGEPDVVGDDELKSAAGETLRRWRALS